MTGARPHAVLSVRSLVVRLGGRDVLRGVSFDIAPGEFTGLIGANGSGKTTLFKAVLGLQPLAAGEVLLDGDERPGGADRPRKVTARGKGAIGYVPQKFLLDPDMPLRARDLVSLGIDGNRLGIPRPSPARRALVDELLDAVGVGELAERRVGLLSGGEQQRVLIAHALAGSPKLLLLDEPLANLDLPSGQEVVELLSRIAHDRGVAVFISAHEMNPLLPVMDRIVYVVDGRAVSGTVAQVVRPEVLSRLYGSHVDVLNVHGRVLVVAGAGDAHDLHGHEAALPGALPPAVPPPAADGGQRQPDGKAPSGVGGGAA